MPGTWIAILVVLLALFAYALFAMVVFTLVMRKTLWCRGKDPDNPCYLRFEDYRDELERKPYRCGYYGKAIDGFLYKEKGRKDFKGFVVLSHGLFGTHLQYLIDIDMLCKAGYVVLAYDQYGCGLSQGRNQESLGTGVYVLENVLRDVRKRNLADGLPLFLYGHSWGAYCALGAVRDFPEVKAVVARSGFVSPTKAGLAALRYVSMPLYYVMLPWIPLLSLLLIGPRNMVLSTRGLKKNRKTKALVLYAKDDPMVDYRNSQAFYYTRHPDPDVEVLLQEKGGHNSLLTEESNRNYHDSVRAYKAIEKIADAEERKKRSEDFVRALRRRDMYRVDEKVRERILSFLEED